MKTASLAEGRAKLGGFGDSSRSDGPVVITRIGKAGVVLIAARDEDDLETLVLRRSPRLLARRSIRQGKGQDEAEFWLAVSHPPPSWDSAKRQAATRCSDPTARSS